MKLKFVLVPLVVLGFAVGSYADCSKDEIFKLIDKGFTKTEINGICGKSEPKKEKSKWISPTDTICTSNGGKVYFGDCKANWENAKKICSASGGSLPTFDELKKVVTDCGGTIDDTANNIANSSYQSCYKEKGFTSYDYWSSTTYVADTGYAWLVGFNGGRTYYFIKSYNFYVRCVRAGQ